MSKNIFFCFPTVGYFHWLKKKKQQQKKKNRPTCTHKYKWTKYQVMHIDYISGAAQSTCNSLQWSRQAYWLPTTYADLITYKTLNVQWMNFFSYERLLGSPVIDKQEFLMLRGESVAFKRSYFTSLCSKSSFWKWSSGETVEGVLRFITLHLFRFSASPVLPNVYSQYGAVIDCTCFLLFNSLGQLLGLQRSELRNESDAGIKRRIRGADNPHRDANVVITPRLMTQHSRASHTCTHTHSWHAALLSPSIMSVSVCYKGNIHPNKAAQMDSGLDTRSINKNLWQWTVVIL